MEFISEISKDFNNLDFTVEIISDMGNHYIGNSADILLSFTDNYDLENIIARGDIVKVIVNNSDLSTDGYDIVVSLNKLNTNQKYNINIADDFVSEFLEKLEIIIMDDYEF